MRYPQATLKILEVYGWHTINLSTGRTFYYNWKYRAFFDALIRRTKISFTEPPDPFTIDSPGCLLTEHAYDVPGLLWRSDKFVEAAKSNLVDPYMVIRLLTEIGASISRLKHWNLQWIKHCKYAVTRLRRPLGFCQPERRVAILRHWFADMSSA